MRTSMVRGALTFILFVVKRQIRLIPNEHMPVSATIFLTYPHIVLSLFICLCEWLICCVRFTPRFAFTFQFVYFCCQIPKRKQKHQIAFRFWKLIQFTCNFTLLLCVCVFFRPPYGMAFQLFSCVQQ